MSEPKEQIEQAEFMIRQGDYHEAAMILGEIVRTDKTDGRAAFDLGNIALFTGEYDLACRYYKEADSYGYINYAIYLNMAVAQERMQVEKRTGSWKSIERLYLQAVRTAGEPQEQIFAASGQTLFYLRHGMMLKAEHEARRLINKFPEQYQGYHLLFLILTEKKQYEDVEKYLKDISERFEDELQYQLDSLAVLEMQEKNEEYLKEAEKMPLILEVLPDMILRKKVEFFGKTGNRKSARKVIDELAENYGDPDAVFAEILLSIKDGDYVKAGMTANLIMEEEREKGTLRFYLTMYLQIFILYMGFDRKPNEEVKSLMSEYAEICLGWFGNNGFDISKLKEEIKMILPIR